MCILVYIPYKMFHFQYVLLANCDTSLWFNDTKRWHVYVAHVQVCYFLEASVVHIRVQIKMRRTGIAKHDQIFDMKKSDRISNPTMSTQLSIFVSFMKCVWQIQLQNSLFDMIYRVLEYKTLNSFMLCICCFFLFMFSVYYQGYILRY